MALLIAIPKPNQLQHLFLAGALLIFGSVRSQELHEYQVKAVFIYNFTSFIKWPENAFADRQAPFVIGVLGSNVFGHFLEQAVAGESVDGHPVRVRIVNESEINQCHILFIPAGLSESPGRILATTSKLPTLTIGEHELFMKQGGMLRLYKDDNRIRIEINQQMAGAAGLEVSSKLLRVAKVYKP